MVVKVTEGATRSSRWALASNRVYISKRRKGRAPTPTPPALSFVFPKRGRFPCSFTNFSGQFATRVPARDELANPRLRSHVWARLQERSRLRRSSLCSLFHPSFSSNVLEKKKKHRDWKIDES